MIPLTILSLETDETVRNLSITANKLTSETDSVSTHEMYRKWGKKWEESWKTCGWHNWTWGCTTHYEDKTDSWSDTRSELAYSISTNSFLVSIR
jgi:hypothetical protein